MYALRFFIGLLEACAFPGYIAILGSWYGPQELAKRTAVLLEVESIASMFSGLPPSRPSQQHERYRRVGRMAMAIHHGWSHFYSNCFVGLLRLARYATQYTSVLLVR